MNRIIAILMVILLVCPANARLQRFHNFGAQVAIPVPTSLFDVYPGCTPYAVAGTRKTWYFAIDPADGNTPLGWQTAGVPQSQWGDATHPLYPIQNLFDFGNSFPYTQSSGWYNQATPIGNNAPLDGMNIYLGLPSVTIHQSFADYNSLVTGDTNHFYFWPGDEVILKGHTGTSAGTWNISSSVGSTSPLGKTSHGLHEIDQAGNTVYVYIHNDPASPRPLFDSITEFSTEGIVLQGMNIYQTYTGYLTNKSSRFFLWGAGNFTAGQTINLNGYVMTFSASPVGAQDVKIGSTQQLSIINAAENFLNSSNPLTNALTVTTQQSNFTLTQTISSQPNPADTINVNGVTWTWVSGTPSGNQIQIGGTLAVSLSNAAAAFKASVLTAMDLFTNYTSGSTSITYTYGPAAQPTNGTALSVNGVTWTFVTGTPSSHQIKISPTNTVATIWETLGNATLAFDAFGANPWGTGVTNASNGSGMNTVSVSNGLSGIYEASSTKPQNDSDNPIHLSAWALGGTQGIRTSSNSVTNFAQDNIFDDILVTGWDNIKQSTLSSLVIDNYPVTGSLGVDGTTGLVVPGNVGGPWDIYDWAVIPNFTGISLSGNQLATSGSNTAGGNSCTTVSNSKIFYVGTGIGTSNMNHVLIENVVSDYIGNDTYDDYSSWDTTWNYASGWNGVNNGQAFHPDFLQVGTSGVNNGVMDNHVYNGLNLEYATDAAMQTNIPGWVNMDGVTQPIQVAAQGVNGNGALHNQFTVENSLFVTPACIGVSVEAISTGVVTLLNNTLIQPGMTASGANRCTTAPSFTPHVNTNTAVTETIDVENNVTNSITMGATTGGVLCPLGSNVTFKDNLVVQSNAGGSLNYFVSSYCPNGAAPGSHPVIGNPVANMFGGGYDAAGAPATAFTTFPTSNPTGNPNNYNLRPLHGGTLDGTGTVNSLTNNVLGQPRVQPPVNIGAY